MNRVILIGNGFDLAHGLPTGYRDFMNSYWKEFAQEFSRYRVFPFEDDFVKFYWTNGEPFYCTIGINPDHFFIKAQQSKSYDDIKQLIDENNRFDGLQFILTFKNDFWKHISEKSYLGKKWVDIETEYYNKLKECLKQNEEDRNPAVKKLNSEFEQVKKHLEKYLTEVCENKEVKKIDSIENAIEANIKYSDIAISKRKLFFNDRTVSDSLRDYGASPNFKRDVNGELDEGSKLIIKQQGLTPQRILFLNFNYTNTAEKLYMKPTDCSLINIHGELNSEENPIIFGYGDESDDYYNEILKTGDDDFLDNIKLILYNNKSNYRRLQEVMQSDSFQVFIMGHSCGNSDRTLLKEIFEHPNCASIKPFYWDKGNGTNDYNDIFKSILRNFSKENTPRNNVVPGEYCKPLVPLKQEVNVHN